MLFVRRAALGVHEHIAKFCCARCFAYRRQERLHKIWTLGGPVLAESNQINWYYFSDRRCLTRCRSASQFPPGIRAVDPDTISTLRPWIPPADDPDPVETIREHDLCAVRRSRRTDFLGSSASVGAVAANRRASPDDSTTHARGISRPWRSGSAKCGTSKSTKSELGALGTKREFVEHESV